MHIRYYLALAATVVALYPFAYEPASARSLTAAALDKLGDALSANQPSTPPIEAGARVESAFSPDGGAESLVLRTIASARQSLRLAAYSFTSAEVVRALLDAKRRGLDVAVVVDAKNNLADDRSGKARAALAALATAGVSVRSISRYAIHHDKYIVADGVTVQTGSFNYSASAASRNSENVIVIWNSPSVAEAYLKHWNSRWAQGVAYDSGY